MLTWCIFTFILSLPALMTRSSKDPSRGSPPPLPESCRRSARINAGIKESLSIEGDHDAKRESSKRRKLKSDSSSTNSDRASSAIAMPPLLNLGKLIRGTLVKRPSTIIKSPYVADVSLFQGKTNKKSSSTAATVLAHAPSLDVGGMCVTGSEVYLSERNGEGKTSHSIELVRGAPMTTTPSSNTSNDSSNTGVLVGAHPRLGELIAEEVLKRGLLRGALTLENGFELGPVNDFSETKNTSPKKKAQAKKKVKSNEKNDDVDLSTDATIDANTCRISLRRQVTLGDSRLDFQMTLTHPTNGTSHRVLLEVKNVVCADYQSGMEPTPTGPGHCVVVAPSNNGNEGYQRSALFPWGRTRGQKFDGQSVVSERACKHLRNLQSLNKEDTTPVVLFIVNRSDCESVRACHEKDPVFAELLEDVVKDGVKALAVRVRWTDEGLCSFDGVVPVVV